MALRALGQIEETLAVNEHAIELDSRCSLRWKR
jgi:hypothetical protein